MFVSVNRTSDASSVKRGPYGVPGQSITNAHCRVFPTDKVVPGTSRIGSRVDANDVDAKLGENAGYFQIVTTPASPMTPSEVITASVSFV